MAALQAIRGMALVNAVTLIAERLDLSRLANPPLMAYLGLVPTEHSSGAASEAAGLPRPAIVQPPAADRGVLGLALLRPGSVASCCSGWRASLKPSAIRRDRRPNSSQVNRSLRTRIPPVQTGPARSILVRLVYRATVVPPTRASWVATRIAQQFSHPGLWME